MVPKLHAHALGEQNPHALGISPFAKPGAPPGFQVFFFWWFRVPLRVPFKDSTRGVKGFRASRL